MRVRLGFWGWVVVGVLGLLPMTSLAQVKTRSRAFAGIDDAGNATTVESSLRVMTEQAAVVFVGTVTRVQRTAGDGFAAAAGVVEVEFAVEQGFRGAAAGQSYTVREWGGLWAGTDQRYKVGSKLLMLLHAPSAAGLSSPVGGMDGAIPVHGSAGKVEAGDETGAVATQMVDLRWISAKLARPVEYRQATKSAGMTGRTAAVQAGVTLLTVNEAEPDHSTAMAQASIETVMAMMSNWAREMGDAR